MSDTVHCPDCGATLDQGSWSEELCPQCLLRLALVESSGDGFEAGDAATAVTRDLAFQALSRGQILGSRYGIRSRLGQGGMGEVWRAFDLKLRVDVALKAVKVELLEHPRVMESLRREVRAAREVASPNVCRVYDLEELDGRELVSMELVQGGTLRDVLRARGPLEIQEAREIASQLLAGLEAIHHADLVHRDLKPENVMITTTGRVVVMDFGIAKGLAEAGTGTVSGTPAYMAPEQSRGEAVDARADVFSAGVVLVEMLAPQDGEELEVRQTLWRGVHQEPPQLPDSPWRAVLERAVAGRPERRFATASDLARALEDVTVRVAGAEDIQPYPGLAAFTATNGEYFFGRELEAERMWKTLRRLSMAALIGPSGAGKTSFLRAGLFATEPTSWSHVICTPGQAPFTSLREALAPELSGDSEAVRELVRIEDPDAMVSAVARWRRRSKHALLVVDQFEELFTLNPPEIQTDFADLLGRLALDADVRVLLSLRDDFLVHCHAHEPLRPILSELTVLGPPAGAALRRAVVQPALKCGYRFEDDELVDEMLAEVEGERGALPLLAFAAEQLWERRERELGLLTREAYEVIGGVGGALAQHAELTLERIGRERSAVVRELFRNLVTAQGTRAVRDRDELLSVFEETDRGGAADVLDALVDARLLTSYGVETSDGGDARQQRVEIVHESLLSAWPRLVRWMAQDVDGARLRDDLRQAARRWQERDRPDDLVWAGSAFQEYRLWRARYPGRLSEIEEAYARAMETLATRRTRRRRIVATTGFAILLAVLTVVTVLWRTSVRQTRRAEASQLVTLGHNALEGNRTSALAMAIASLRKADTPEGRRLALRALWAGPPATVLSQDREALGLAFSTDGSSLAAGFGDGVLRVFPRSGDEPFTFQGFEEDQGNVHSLAFSPDGRQLIGGASQAGGQVRVWETRGWLLERTLQPPEPPETLLSLQDLSFSLGLFEPDLPTILTVTFRPQRGPGPPRGPGFGHWLLRRWPRDDGHSTLVAEIPATLAPVASADLEHGLLVSGLGKQIHLHSLDTLGSEPPRVVARHDTGFALGSPAFDPTSKRLAACDAGGTLRVWPVDGDGTRPERELEAPGWPAMTAFSPDGSRLAHASYASHGKLWNLRGPTFAEPLRLGAKDTKLQAVAFTPDGRWLATAGSSRQRFRLAMWPMSDIYPRVLSPAVGAVRRPVLFHPDGSRVFTRVTGQDGIDALLSWSLTGGAGLEPTVLFRGTEILGGTVDPLGRFLILTTARGVFTVPLDGTEPALLEGVGRTSRVELDPRGTILASNPNLQQDIVAVHDLVSGEGLELEQPGDGPVTSFHFDAAGHLLVTRGGVLSLWNPNTKDTEILVGEGIPSARPVGDGRRLYIPGEGPGSILDLEDGSRIPLPEAHSPAIIVAFGPTGSIVATGHPNGDVRVGPLFDNQPHLLLGHEGFTFVWISPDGKWVASRGEDGTVRLWPMPDFSKRPLHVLPYRELMSRLEDLTNVRAVPSDVMAAGFVFEPDTGATRGWGEVPEW